MTNEIFRKGPCTNQFIQEKCPPVWGYRQTEPLTNFTHHYHMTLKSFEKGRRTSRAVACILDRLEKLAPHRKRDPQAYIRLARLLEYIYYAETQPPFIILKEPLNATLGHYMPLCGNVQIYDKVVRCPHCGRFVLPDRISRSRYQVHYISCFGSSEYIDKQYIGLDCLHPLGEDTQDMETLVLIEPTLTAVYDSSIEWKRTQFG